MESAEKKSPTKNYLVIPVTNKAALFQDESAIQIRRVDSLPPSIINDFVQHRRPVIIILKNQRHTGILVRSIGETLELDIKSHPLLSRDDNILIIFDHPKLRPFRVMQTQFVRKSFNWFMFESRDPRLDYRYGFHSNIEVNIFPIPGSVLEFLLSQRLVILREIVVDQETPEHPFCGCFDYLMPHDNLPEPDTGIFAVHPVHDEIVSQKPTQATLKNMSLGGIGIILPETAIPGPIRKAFFFELNLTLGEAKLNIGLRVIGVVRHSKPTQGGLVELNVTWIRRISDDIIGSKLKIMAEA